MERSTEGGKGELLGISQHTAQGRAHPRLLPGCFGEMLLRGYTNAYHGSNILWASLQTTS